MERGKKNRRNMRKQVVKKPAMLAQTMRRRILFTGGSVLVSTIGAEPFPLGRAAAAGTDGGGTREAGGVAVPTGTLGSSADISRLTSLSNCKTSVQKELAMRSKLSQATVAFAHVHGEAECELYNSPRCRDCSLRSSASY